jgi:hypothetical protein
MKGGGGVEVMFEAFLSLVVGGGETTMVRLLSKYPGGNTGTCWVKGLSGSGGEENKLYLCLKSNPGRPLQASYLVNTLDRVIILVTRSPDTLCPLKSRSLPGSGYPPLL